MSRTPTAATQKSLWSLEVVRGRDPGREYALGAGETVLGNALDGLTGVDLRDQEENSPRRMAGRQAALSATGPELTIRDLASPGGTFVNRQRLLSGQARRLAPGDLIQVGSVQLQVKRHGSAPARPPAPAASAAANAVAPNPTPVSAAAREAPPPARAAAPAGGVSGRLPVPFTMAGNVVCRSWDDFLVLAAGRWEALREELSSGRLADYLRRVQRPDLVPRWEKGRAVDEQLDEWLGRLPATRASAAELDVHPESLTVAALPGGGLTHHSLRVTNVGYRLLRTTARIEPAGASWLRLRPEYQGRSFTTIDQTELPLELEIPETVDSPLTAAVVLESNGGTKRVEMRLERAGAPAALPVQAVAAGSVLPRWGASLGERIAHVPALTRVVFASGLAAGLRLLIALLSLLPLGAQGSRPLEPRLAAIALVLIGAGALGGSALALARNERQELAAAGFAGGALGLLAAAVFHAVIQSLEHILGAWSTSIWIVGIFWAALGALLALLSTLLVPHSAEGAEAAP
jgi:FHA domain